MYTIHLILNNYYYMLFCNHASLCDDGCLCSLYYADCVAGL